MGHASTPPGIPDVHDEAGDSPKWLPALGAGTFALLVLWVLWGAELIGDGPSEHTPLFDSPAQAGHGHDDHGHAGHGH